MTKTAVFTTSDILSYTETVKGFNVDPPFKVIADHGVLGEHSYSSFGALEKALAEGYKVYVVTSRAELGPQDEWWIKKVGEENVFKARVFCGATCGHAKTKWREFIENVLELKAPDDTPHQSWMDLMESVRQYGVKLGEDFLPWKD